MNYLTINYIVNITVINTDNHNYCIVISKLTNDRETESKILNDSQFTINIVINNKLHHLCHNLITLIMIINSIN